MKTMQEKLLNAFLASHHGVISRSEAMEIGLSTQQVDWCLRVGRWRAVHRGVYMRAGEVAGPAARLLAACLAAGPDAVASHASAAWLWGLVDDPGTRPSVTVPSTRSARLPGVTLHRRDDLDAARTIVRRGIPATDPLRTLADLGEVVRREVLDDAVDRAVATRLVALPGLQQEIERLARPGRRGIDRLRRALEERGFTEAPAPSVLESRTLRLLRGWGITPAGVQVSVLEGRYRLDVLLVPGVALEVDGFAYHSSPEAKAADSRRRNELRLAGMVVIEADWVTVTRAPEALRRTVTAALEAGRTVAS